MFTNMKLTTKVIVGFVTVVMISAATGLIGWYGISSLNNDLAKVGNVALPKVSSLITITEKLERLRVAQRTLLSAKLTKVDRDRQYANYEKTKIAYINALAAYENLPDKSAKEEEKLKEFKSALAGWQEVNDRFNKKSQELDALCIPDPDDMRAKMEQFRGDHARLEVNVFNMIESGKEFAGGDDHTVCNFGKWLNGLKDRVEYKNPVLSRVINANLEKHTLVHKCVKDLKTAIKGNDKASVAPIIADFKTAAHGVANSLEEIIGECGKAQKIFNDMLVQNMNVCRDKQELAVKPLNELVTEIKDTSDKTVKAGQQNGQFNKVVTMFGIVIGVFIGILLSIVIIRATNKVIRGIVLSLSDGATQVASASGQVASSSQALAEGTTEQAASLEETSSALEEMASMTKQNADNAKTANNLSVSARDAADEGNRAMSEMLTAMNSINESSGKISKIIKVIEEIAFQTNLLALNAAVEAARAGDAGKGFAVVADEVRNLAQRAATAAKDTTSLIEDSVSRTSRGQDIANKSNEALKNIVINVKKAADLVGEISAASQEQAQGIEQINNAIAQMDKVTQSNAANAEESASASEELSAQAASLMDLLKTLGGDSSTVDVAQRGKTGSAPRHLEHKQPAKDRGNGHGQDKQKHATNETYNRLNTTIHPKPEEIIPLRDEFKEF